MYTHSLRKAAESIILWVHLAEFSFRFAAEILNAPAFSQLKQETLEILTSITEIPQFSPPKVRTRDSHTMTFPTNASRLNLLIQDRFVSKGWERNPLITNDGLSKIKADYLKGRVIVEVQFGNMGRWYADLYKFQLSVSLGNADVGVSVVAMKHFAETMDENVAHYERVVRELGYARNSIAVPIWVIGIEP
jgi:hypothetical protein